MIRYPFTDLTGDKRRPAILITDSGTVRGLDGHFVFVGTEEPPPGYLYIEIPKVSADARAMGLKFWPEDHAAYIQPRKIMTLEVSLVTRRIGITPAPILERILGMLAPALGAVTGDYTVRWAVPLLLPPSPLTSLHLFPP